MYHSETVSSVFILHTMSYRHFLCVEPNTLNAFEERKSLKVCSVILVNMIQHAQPLS